MFLGSRRSTRRAPELPQADVARARTARRWSSRGRLGVAVAINIIADPDWDKERFDVVRRVGMEIPEIVNISVATPYPGTEIWHTERAA